MHGCHYHYLQFVSNDLGRRLMSRKHRDFQDGVFALDENDSVAALKIGLKKGYKIPEELSIIGFADGILASRRLSPSLTTVSQHGVDIGEVAAKLLIDRLESKEEHVPYETVVIKTKLKERESTRKL